MSGTTLSADFPTTSDAFDLTLGGSSDVFLTQLGATGGVLLYSTYFGGTDTQQSGGVGVARSGNRIFLFGVTVSSDLPLAGSPLQPAYAGAGDHFTAWFDF